MNSAISFEKVPTEWFDESAIRLPDYSVGRVSYGNGRSYIRLTDGELESPFRLYTSLTTAINTCAPMERGLLEWNVKLGLQEAERQVKISQHYGTLMHLLIGSFLQTGATNLDELEERVQDYLSDKNYWQPECSEWVVKLKYDLLAFALFFSEHKVKPLGIEYVLLSEKYGFGTLIDLVCEMTIEEKGFFGEVYKSGENKGQPKETKQDRTIMAIVNFKSGRHAFYRNSGIQMIAEKLLWEENFPDLPLEAAYNWSPKEWITFPDYNMKDWAGEIEIGEVEAIMKLAGIRFGDKALNKKYISLSGVHYKGGDISKCINTASVEEYCMQHFTAQPI